MKVLIKSIIAGFTLAAAVFAAWDYPGCEDISGNDFKLVPLATKITYDPTALEPLKMAFDMDDQGVVTVYWVERRGAVKRYNTGGAGNAELIGTLEPATGSEDGVVGIALDPGFKENRWIYLMYSFEEHYRISRFTLAGDMLDLSSEVELLWIPSERSKFHTGGGMAFDDYGDLWITIGDNQQGQIGPSNTADLRGGILRIRPEDDGSYTIPAGNYWEFGAAYFEKLGQADIAAEYRNPEKVRREIYAKGMRNPYTIGLDPVRRWATFGDCGPDHEIKDRDMTDTSRMTEEHSMVLEPGFFGWPYWSGTRNVTPEYPYGTREPFWGSQGMSAPLNTHETIQGVPQLTPQVPGDHTYPHACAVGAIIPRYYPRSNAVYKIPPHLHRKWIVLNLGGYAYALNLNEQGRVASPKIREELWGPGPLGNDWAKYLDLQQGPDGAVYAVAYNCRGAANRTPSPCTGIWRIEYTGPECVTGNEFVEETAGCMNGGDANYNPVATHHDSADCANTASLPPRMTAGYNPLSLNNTVITVNTRSDHIVTVTDTRGRIIREWSGREESRYFIPSAVPSGLYIISLRTAHDNISRKTFIH